MTDEAKDLNDRLVVWLKAAGVTRDWWARVPEALRTDILVHAHRLDTAAKSLRKSPSTLEKQLDVGALRYAKRDWQAFKDSTGRDSWKAFGMFVQDLADMTERLSTRDRVGNDEKTPGHVRNDPAATRSVVEGYMPRTDPDGEDTIDLLATDKYADKLSWERAHMLQHDFETSLTKEALALYHGAAMYWKCYLLGTTNMRPNFTMKDAHDAAQRLSDQQVADGYRTAFEARYWDIIEQLPDEVRYGERDTRNLVVSRLAREKETAGLEPLQDILPRAVTGLDDERKRKVTMLNIAPPPPPPPEDAPPADIHDPFTDPEDAAPLDEPGPRW